MKFKVFISLVVAVLLSIVASKIVYFGFTPNYAADIFSRQAFNGRFDHDVYKYRILSKYLLFAVDDRLAKKMPAKGAEARILINTPGGSERFYLAFYYLNTFFLILTSIMLVLLVNLRQRLHFTEIEKNLIIFFVPLLIALSQFTVCCYDVSGYFFQLLILYIFLRFSSRHFWPSIAVISVLIILSTLNRESSALSVSMMAVLLLTGYGLTRRPLIATGLLAACFLATYLALHYFIIDPMHARIIAVQAGKLFIDTNMIGLLFWALFFYLPFAMVTEAENRALIGLYFVFSLPYIITCLKDGILWEIRLYIPLLLSTLFLSRINFCTHVIRLMEIEVLRIPRREMR